MFWISLGGKIRILGDVFQMDESKFNCGLWKYTGDLEISCKHLVTYFNPKATFLFSKFLFAQETNANNTIRRKGFTAKQCNHIVVGVDIVPMSCSFTAHVRFGVFTQFVNFPRNKGLFYFKRIFYTLHWSSKAKGRLALKFPIWKMSML